MASNGLVPDQPFQGRNDVLLPPLDQQPLGVVRQSMLSFFKAATSPGPSSGSSFGCGDGLPSFARSR